VFAVSGAMVLTGCAHPSESPGPSTSTPAAANGKVDAIAATVPDAIRAAGKLVVGVNVAYPPNEFKDPGGRIVGFDVDLMNAIVSTLGLRADFRESAFDAIIPSIQRGSYDLGMSSFTDTRDREAKVDFVDYFSAGTLWAQRPGPPINPDAACGLKVAVQSRTTQETVELPAKSAACAKEGKPAITIVEFDEQDGATQAVVSGRADAMSADSPVTSYAVKQSAGRLEGAGEIFGSAPYGWPVQKGSPLAQSLLQALQHVMATGSYQAIAAKWGARAGLIAKPAINGAVS
jgi:polar amino acid transport system substrate-binding protein